MYSDLRVFVIGDGMIDEWIEGTSYHNEVGRKEERMVNPSITKTLGGAYNMAVNLKTLGANVTFFGVLPEQCEYSEFVVSEFEKYSIDAVFIYSVYANPVIQRRHFCDGKYITWVSFTNHDKMPFSVTNQIYDNIRQYAMLNEPDALSIWDYDEGTVTRYIICTLIEWAKANGIKVFVDPKIESFWVYKDVCIIKCSEDEAMSAFGDSQIHLPQAICSKLNSRYAVITLGNSGLMFNNNDKLGIVRGVPVEKVRCDVGAGDATFAAIILEYLRTLDIEQACKLGNLAGSIVVTKPHCGSVTLGELVPDAT